MAVHPLDTAALVVSLLSLLTWAMWVMSNRGKLLYAVPPVTWTLNVIAFYVTTPLHGQQIHELWTDFLLLHASLLIFGIGVVMILERFIVKDAP
jgi:hypothetical protein